MTVSNEAYLPPPKKEEFEFALTMVEGRARAQRKPRISKLMPHTLRIKHWLSSDYSYQKICDLIFQLSKVKAHRSTLMRFIHANPLLLKKCS